MVLLLAAGMASQGAAFLVQADALPTLGDSLWDTSAWLGETSLAGRILHTLVGYVAQPMGIQLLFYALTLVVFGTLTETFGKRGAGVPAAATRVAGAAPARVGAGGGSRAG
jgi:high-affinity iron transporter